MVLGKSKPPKTKAEKDANSKRISYVRIARKGFHSRFIRYPGKDNRGIEHNLYKVCHDVYYKYLHDDIKAPIGCPGLPAYFSPAATNFYFAVNKKDHGDSMEVTSCGFGSGGLSTGLNPETMRINPMYTTML